MSLGARSSADRPRCLQAAADKAAAEEATKVVKANLTKTEATSSPSATHRAKTKKQPAILAEPSCVCCQAAEKEASDDLVIKEAVDCTAVVCDKRGHSAKAAAAAARAAAAAKGE